MRPEIPDEWGIKTLQNCILNIACYIDEFCNRHNIDYCIMGGSALGAVRHGGFIPWDDDMDIFMTPQNYLKFAEAFKKHGDSSTYYLQELGKSGEKVVYAKLRLNNSSFKESIYANMDIHHGVYVDIMIQHVLPDSAISRYWMVGWQAYLELKALANRNYLKRGKLVNTLLKPLKWLPKRFLLDFALKQVWRYKDYSTSNYFHYYISQPLRRSIYPKKCLEKYEYIDFETIRLRIPKDVRQYLGILFGDYMRIPDLNKIKWAQHVEEWSVEKAFEKVGEGKFKDEKYLW